MIAILVNLVPWHVLIIVTTTAVKVDFTTPISAECVSHSAVRVCSLWGNVDSTAGFPESTWRYAHDEPIDQIRDSLAIKWARQTGHDGSITDNEARWYWRRR